MRRGEIHPVVDAKGKQARGLADSGPAKHAALALVVSNDGANMAVTRLGRGGVSVVPLCPPAGRLRPFWVLVPAEVASLRSDVVARAELTTSIPLERLGPLVGALSAPLMDQVDTALRLHLALV